MKIAKVEAIPYAIPYRKPLALRERRDRRRRARPGAGAHRRRRRRPGRRPAPAVHLRRDADLGPLRHRRPLRARHRGRLASSSARSSTPGSTARSATRSPRPPSTWPSGTPSARPSASRSPSCSVASPTGCRCRTWSASLRRPRWSPRPNGCATPTASRPSRSRSAVSRTADDVDACRALRDGARRRRRALHRRQPRLDAERGRPRPAPDGRPRPHLRRGAVPRRRRPRPPMAGRSTIPMFADESVARPGEVTRELLAGAATGISIKTVPHRVHHQPSPRRAVRGTRCRRRLGNQIDSQVGSLCAVAFGAAFASSPAAPASCPTSST